jgi:hypothetical protein
MADVHDAILPRYTDVVVIGNNVNSDHAPGASAINGGNFDGENANINNSMGHMCRGPGDDIANRVATLAAVWGSSGGGSSGRKRWCRDIGGGE